MTPDPLADSKSPFLRHGADQPVDWLPWGDTAFRKAAETDRPILMDIGAVWCHWCHVMDRESYDDPETAALINELYVPVKVDRDERPDVDSRYQRAVQSLTGQGGWPLTVFMTPDGDVFHGGTYFPPEDAHGRPAFRRVLREVARVWREDRPRVRTAVQAVQERLGQVLVGESSPGELDPRLLDHAVDAFAQNYDATHGGFGSAPKFPTAGGLGLLLDRWLDADSELARGMVEGTLLAMVRGGIYDQLGGGFHRYSVDARWIIPHFEKMAYDNGPLLEVLARATVALGDEPGAADGAEEQDPAGAGGAGAGAGAELRAAAEGVVAHYRDIAADLVDEGGFPASQDADIGFDDDGDYWTWTADEVRAALGAEAGEGVGETGGAADTASSSPADVGDEGDAEDLADMGDMGDAGDAGDVGGHGGRDAMAEAAILRWGVRDSAGAMHLDPDRHVLFQAMAVEDVARRLDRPAVEVRELLGQARRRLKATRDERPAPYIDGTLYSGWVALVASGHLAVARHLASGSDGSPSGEASPDGSASRGKSSAEGTGSPDRSLSADAVPTTQSSHTARAGEDALRALERVWRESWQEDRGLVHRVGDPDSGIMLADQAHVARALLDAFEWSQDEVWLARARGVVSVIRRRFAHPSGGLRDLPDDQEGAGPLRQDRLEITDSPEPSPTAVAAESMARIAALDHDDDLVDAARSILEAYAGFASRYATGAPTYFRALRWVAEPATTVVVVEADGDRAGARGGSLTEAALRSYRPATVVRWLAPESADDAPLPDAVRAMLTGEAPRAYVCAGTVCARPVSEAGALRELLESFRG